MNTTSRMPDGQFIYDCSLYLNPTERAAAVITQRGAALSYSSLPNMNNCNVSEKQPIEGMVFLNWLYRSFLIKFDKYCTPLSRKV